MLHISALKIIDGRKHLKYFLNKINKFSDEKENLRAHFNEAYVLKYTHENMMRAK